MALYGRRRDINVFLSLNNELLNGIIQQEVDYYKLHLSETGDKDDLYGESVSEQRTYYRPLRLPCLIERQDITTSVDAFGVDKNQLINFRFLRAALKYVSLVPQEGDIIELRGNYYEVDAVNQNQFVVGKDYEHPKDATNFGENFSIVCQTHWTRVSKLQIIKARN